MPRFTALVILWCVAALPLSAAHVTLIGNDIPEYYPTGSSLIYSGSDSLYLNSRLLTRNEDYRFDPIRRGFNLSMLDPAPGDTLVLVYTPTPAWLAMRYGRPLPEIVPSIGAKPSIERPRPERSGPPKAGLSLSGAKSFRFNARSAGSADFGQSLDLNVSGELTPGLIIRGAVSDRGYDPVHGTVNSRLNELNKINLELESQHFLARVGDIELANRLPTLQSRSKRVTGAWLTARDENWYIESAVARPKGLYETARFSGEDGVQGPYRIGGRVEPIVPGSESVWLDGERLERGSNNDYTMDYPAGTITFNVNHPIDRRRRIEIDFEPQATDYREELFTSGGGVAVGDSTFTFETGWLREGDDEGSPIIGELSDFDRAILAEAGDSTVLAYRSGVRADTSGNYRLAADSLPDSIYQWVGPGAGEYAVTFSYIGSGSGAYRNLGANRFEYVGPGNGDYQPIVLLAAPERTDQYVARGRWKNSAVGELTAEYRHSEFDRNLFSSLDDTDNAGDLYSLRFARNWGEATGDGIALHSRFRGATFHTRDRLYEPEFNRRHHLPETYVPGSDEWWHEGSLSITPLAALTLAPSGSLVHYDDGTESQSAALSMTVRPHNRVELGAGLRSVTTGLATGSRLADGAATTLDAAIRYQPAGDWRIESEVEHDDRTNLYTGQQQGTRFMRYRTSVGQKTEQVRIEHYVEDSLSGDWNELLRRTRLELHSARRLNDLSYQSMLAYQWLDQPEFNEESFLGRLNLQYANVEHRLNVGATYLMSDETRNVRGLSFLEVEPGRGDYVYEDGRYIPDPNGNYIRVEEILSDRSPVSRGEKSFYLSKDWGPALVRFTSRTEEELLDIGSRTALWVMPFYSDPNQPYQFHRTRYTGELRFIPIRNAHAVNLEGSRNSELRTIGGSNRERKDWRGILTLRQTAKQTHLEESFALFEADRDDYYTGGGVIDGWQVEFGVRQLIAAHELSAGSGYRTASSVTGEESQQYLLRGGVRLAVISRGELRSNLELYRQELTGVTGLPSYTLTENRYGSRGANWSLEFRYGLRRDFRVSFAIDGRHSNDRTARVTARGEMVAGF